MSELIDVVIQGASEADAPGIRAVHAAAFGGPAEARLVDLLRERERSRVSLVAVERDRVVGHVLFSPVTIETAPPGASAVGLGPVGVLPDLQRRGIGKRLIVEGIERCRAAGHDAVVVLGAPAYYGRFGFRRAADHGLANEYGADEAFMMLELAPGAAAAWAGLVRYAPEFGEAGC